MGKSFRTDDLDQLLLLPPSLHDWLPERHLARFLVDVVDAMDMSAIYASYDEKDGRGQSAYLPEIPLLSLSTSLVSVWIRTTGSRSRSVPRRHQGQGCCLDRAGRVRDPTNRSHSNPVCSEYVRNQCGAAAFAGHAREGVDA